SGRDNGVGPGIDDIGDIRVVAAGGVGFAQFGRRHVGSDGAPIATARVATGDGHQVIVYLLPFDAQVFVDAQDLRRPDRNRENHVHAGNLVRGVGGIPLALAVVDVMDVIFSVRFFYKIGKVPVKLHRTLDQRIRAIAQPVGIARVLVTLPEQVGNARTDAEDMGAMAENFGCLRILVALPLATFTVGSLAAFGWDDKMAVVVVAVGQKIIARIVAVLRFDPELKVRGTLRIWFAYQHQVLQLRRDGVRQFVETVEKSNFRDPDPLRSPLLARGNGAGFRDATVHAKHRIHQVEAVGGHEVVVISAGIGPPVLRTPTAQVAGRAP